MPTRTGAPRTTAVCGRTRWGTTGLSSTHDGCEDWADHTPPFNDPDSTSTELVPVNDTPPDPCKFERFKLDANGDPKPGRDEDGNGNLIGLHDWCQTSG